MSGLFYNIGRMVGPHVRRAKWVWQSMTGTEADSIKVENDVGRDLAREVRRQLKPDLQPQAEEMLNKIGSRLAACSPTSFARSASKRSNAPNLTPSPCRADLSS